MRFLAEKAANSPDSLKIRCSVRAVVLYNVDRQKNLPSLTGLACFIIPKRLELSWKQNG